MINKKGSSGIKVLILLLIVAYAGFVGYQYISNAILVKEVKKYFTEKINYFTPVKDWDGTMNKVIDGVLIEKKIDRDTFQCSYELKDSDRVIALDISYLRTIDWIFKKEVKEYHLNFSFELHN
jgi:hypothetical protein